LVLLRSVVAYRDSWCVFVRFFRAPLHWDKLEQIGLGELGMTYEMWSLTPRSFFLMP
jgi:hypothetical protein